MFNQEDIINRITQDIPKVPAIDPYEDIEKISSLSVRLTREIAQKLYHATRGEATVALKYKAVSTKTNKMVPYFFDDMEVTIRFDKDATIDDGRFYVSHASLPDGRSYDYHGRNFRDHYNPIRLFMQMDGDIEELVALLTKAS